MMIHVVLLLKLVFSTTLLREEKMERLFYLSDNFFATNPYSSGLLLCVITLALVVMGGSLHWLATGCDGSLASHMWTAWRFVTDGGDYHEQSWAARAVGLVLVLSGMLFFALLSKKTARALFCSTALLPTTTG